MSKLFNKYCMAFNVEAGGTPAVPVKSQLVLLDVKALEDFPDKSWLRLGGPQSNTAGAGLTRISTNFEPSLG